MTTITKSKIKKVNNSKLKKLKLIGGDSSGSGSGSISGSSGSSIGGSIGGSGEDSEFAKALVKSYKELIESYNSSSITQKQILDFRTSIKNMLEESNKKNYSDNETADASAFLYCFLDKIQECNTIKEYINKLFYIKFNINKNINNEHTSNNINIMVNAFNQDYINIDNNTIEKHDNNDKYIYDMDSSTYKFFTLYYQDDNIYNQFLGIKDNLIKLINSLSKNSKNKQTLIGIIWKSGDAGGGHYISTVKYDKWYVADDSTIYKVDQSEINKLEINKLEILKKSGVNFYPVTLLFKDNDTIISGDPHGIINGGNTCYINSMLQLLLQVPELTKLILDGGGNNSKTTSNSSKATLNSDKTTSSSGKATPSGKASSSGKNGKNGKSGKSGSIPIPSVPIVNKSAEEIIDNLINKLTKISKNISIKENPTGIDILNSINSLDLLGTFNKDFHNVLKESNGGELSQLEYSKIINGEKDNDWPNKNDIEDLRESIVNPKIKK